MLSLEQLSRMVSDHLGLSSCDDVPYSKKWTIAESPHGGRGLFATEDLSTGEVLYVDRSLVAGPRAGMTVAHGCTVCSKLQSETFIKCHKCALLLCSTECQNNEVHYDDCKIISNWSNKVPIEEIDDTQMSRALVAIRALLLDDDQKRLMAYLEAHMLPQHGSEIRELIKYFEIPDDELDLMIHTSCALDTNAYEIAIPFGATEISRRGLFPVASLMNHNCVPNTRLTYNKDSQMVVKTVKPIRAGTEIYSIYTGLLWGTPARRVHLYKTKHFLCECERCADPTERGTLLAALRCFSAECPGSLLPAEPLKASGPWRCLQCAMTVPGSNVCAVQKALGTMMSVLDFDNVDELEHFLLNRIHKFIPKTNQIMVDLQCRLIWYFGESHGIQFHELSASRLSLKEGLCRSTLRTLAALGAGDAHLRGLLLYHLHAALAERARRNPNLYEELKSEIESTIEQAYFILQGDISAPPDLELRRRYLGPGCDKPQEERFFILAS